MWKPTPPPAREYKKVNQSEIAAFSQFIYTMGESPILKKKAKSISLNAIHTQDFKAKVQYLKECFMQFRKITNGKGRGIAAPQVGISESFFLLFNSENDKISIFINPKITKKADYSYLYPEACMSANSLIAKVLRPAWIEFEYLNEEGEKEKWKVKDTNYEGKVANRIVQHEIDHLNGIINIDKVPSKSLKFEMGTEYYGKERFQKVKGE